MEKKFYNAKRKPPAITNGISEMIFTADGEKFRIIFVEKLKSEQQAINEVKIEQQGINEVKIKGTNTSSNTSTYPNSIIYGNFELVISQYPENWKDAQAICLKMGKDWYLPSKRQMLLLSQSLTFESNKHFFWTDDEGILNTSNYAGKDWSSSNYDAAEVIDVFAKSSVNFDYKTKSYYFICIHSLGNNSIKLLANQNSSVKIDYLDVLTTSLFSVNFYEAQSIQSQLSNGWRLPTKDELNLIYNKRNLLSNDFNSLDLTWYWSSNNFMNDNTTAWTKQFDDGKESSMDKSSKIRALYVKGNANDALINTVKSIPTFRIGNLTVMESDLVNPINNSSEFTYSEALEIVAKLGDRWRLPTIEELRLIYDNTHNNNYSFYNAPYKGTTLAWKTYWSSSNDNTLKYPDGIGTYGSSGSGKWILWFNNGACFVGGEKYFVRPVKK